MLVVIWSAINTLFHSMVHAQPYSTFDFENNTGHSYEIEYENRKCIEVSSVVPEAWMKWCSFAWMKLSTVKLMELEVRWSWYANIVQDFLALNNDFCFHTLDATLVNICTNSSSIQCGYRRYWSCYRDCNIQTVNNTERVYPGYRSNMNTNTRNYKCPRAMN